MKKLSSFEQFFSEPINFGLDDYVMNSRGLNEEQAIKIYTDFFMDWLQWIPRENRKYVAYEVSHTIGNGWVKWHAGLDDDGQPRNAWWLYRDYKGGKPGYKHVFVAKFNKHYAEMGHHFEPTINESGRRNLGSDCNICGGMVLS